MPQDIADASSLFENDNNVEIASSRSRCSRQDSSLEASRPPTSDSEGMFDDPGDSGKEEVDNDERCDVSLIKENTNTKHTHKRSKAQ